MRIKAWVGSMAGAVIAAAALWTWLSRPAEEPVIKVGEQPEKVEEPALEAPKAPKKKGVSLTTSFQVPADLAEEMSHVPCVVFSPDGKHLFTATNNGALIIWDAGTREVLQRIELSKKVRTVHIEPVSGRVAWSPEEGGIHLTNLADTKTRLLVKNVKPKALRISPDARLVAFAAGSTLEIRDLEEGTTVYQQTFKTGVEGMDWSADGERFAVVTKGGLLSLHDASYRVVRTVQKPSALYAVAFSPDGGHLSFGGVEKRIYQIALPDGKEEIIAQNQPYDITSLGYSPDGSRLAVGDESCDIWIFRLKDKLQVFHSKHHVECWLNRVAWSPDGKRFLFGCRPNTHAGTPTTYSANTIQEATQDPGVMALDLDVKKIYADLEKRVGEEVTQELAQLRTPVGKVVYYKSLDVTESPNDEEFDKAKGETLDAMSDMPFKGMAIYDSIGGGGGGGGKYVPQPAVLSKAQIEKLKEKLKDDPEAKELLEKLEAALKERGEVYDAKLKELNAQKLINCWELKD